MILRFSIAKQLAKLLKADVYAPTDKVSIHPDGSLTVGKERIPFKENAEKFTP